MKQRNSIKRNGGHRPTCWNRPLEYCMCSTKEEPYGDFYS